MPPISDAPVKSSVINAEIEEMKGKLTEKDIILQNLHDRASEDLVFALQNPLFVEYFDLPETKAGNVYQDGVLQFTDRQNQIKSTLEQQIYHFQNKFQVDETCLIDVTGQEHARLVLTKIETNENLSPDESINPFFAPSFKKNKDEVHIQYPYLSPDTNRWVFAYTSPVVLGDGEKPAFFHFEMPISIFQDLVSVDHGRMYVIDTQGYLIADSQYQFPTTNIPKDFTEFFPVGTTIFPPTEFDKLLQLMKSDEQGIFNYEDEDGDIYHLTFIKLPTFGWYLVYQESEELMLSGFQTELGSVVSSIAIISTIITVGGLVTIFFISEKITRPIINLRNSAKMIEDGIFDTEIKSTGTDEISESIGIIVALQIVILARRR